MLKKKDLNKIRRVKWRRLGGGGRVSAHKFSNKWETAHSMEKHSRKESELKTFERNQTPY